ncbi:MAG: DUF3786 domain-containing protein [Desulfobacterales bacterium]
MDKLEAKRAEVFKENYRLYLSQLAGIDMAFRASMLDIAVEGGTVQVTFFGRRFLVTAENITDEAGARAPYDVCVVLARYLLMCPKRFPAEDAWSAYRDFKDSGPLTVFFADSVEGAIAAAFSGRLSELSDACRALGGVRPAAELSYDLTVQIPALPRVPLLLLFNDADEEFPAQCSVLFEARAERFLDAESLAILGSQLAQRLQTDG